MQAADLLERIRQCAMPEGSVACRGTWLRQEGEMRFDPGRPWMPFQAEQWLCGEGIDFRWKAWIRMAPLMRARVLDCFEGGRGRLTAMIFGLLPVARSRGPATDKGEALRGLAELPWRPSAFRETAQLQWAVIEPGKLRATFDDGRTQTAIEFDVDGEGQVQGAAAHSRPRIAGGSVVETAWSGAFHQYKMFDGVRVPTMAEVAWHPPEGSFTYWRAHITDFRVLR